MSLQSGMDPELIGWGLVIGATLLMYGLGLGAEAVAAVSRWRRRRRAAALFKAAIDSGLTPAGTQRVTGTVGARAVEVSWMAEPELMKMRVVVDAASALSGLGSQSGPGTPAPVAVLDQVLDAADVRALLSTCPEADFSVLPGALVVTWDCLGTRQDLETRLAGASELANRLDGLAPTLPDRLAQAAKHAPAAGWLAQSLFPRHPATRAAHSAVANGTGPEHARLRSALHLGEQGSDALEALAFGQNTDVALRALRRLLSAADAVPLALRALSHPVPEARHLALQHLAHSGGADDVHEIVALSRQEGYAPASASALGALGGELATRRLVELLGPDQSTETQAAAVQGLSRCGDRIAVERLSHLAETSVDLADAARTAIQCIVDRVGGQAGSLTLADTPRGAITLAEEAGALELAPSADGSHNAGAFPEFCEEA
ncbi:MAG: hypothetical protein ACI9WU_003751 [Myxococcota bacterium]|jgi:hypothetical protein